MNIIIVLLIVNIAMSSIGISLVMFAVNNLLNVEGNKIDQGNRKLIDTMITELHGGNGKTYAAIVSEQNRALIQDVLANMTEMKK